MPIVHIPVTQPPLPVAPNVLPVNQRVLPTEPARRVTPNKEAGRTNADPDKKRQQQPREEGDRGGQLDLEV
jgi:hypothetical protein